MHSMDNELSKSRLRLWLKLLKKSRYIESEVRELLRVEFMTTLPRFDVLAALYRYSEGLKMSELSSVLRVSNGNVTGIVDRLEADKMLERLPVKNDRRAMIVKLSAHGRREFDTMLQAHEKWINDMLLDLDINKIDSLLELLDQIDSDGGKMP